MKKWTMGFVFCIAVFPVSGIAQDIITMSPTGNSTGLTGSNISQTSGGNIGIGTTSPSYLLQVNNTSTGASVARIGSTSADNGISGEVLSVAPGVVHFDGNEVVGGHMTILDNGNVGIGNVNPQGTLDVLSAGGQDVLLGGGGNVGSGTGTGSEVKFRYPSASHFSIYNRGDGNLTIANTSSSGQLNTLGTPILSINQLGNVVLSVSGAGITFPNGVTQTVPYTGLACGGDFAESVDVTGVRTTYEPGDLMVADPDNPGKFLKSAEPYSTLVSGIYSTKPGELGRRQTTEKSPDEVPMAVVGIVPAKVSAENGPIKTGDLLVTSSTLGYAMKGTDRSRLIGAVVGKALGSLESGTGVIEVLVSLQ